MVKRFLHGCARYGRFILVLGLLAGAFLQDLALALKAWLPVLVATLLLLSAMRIGPRQMLGGLADVKASLVLIVAYQVVMPLVLFVLADAVGLDATMTTAILLMAAAAPLLGASNLTILTGNDPAPSLRLLVIGLALLPFTIIPTLLLVPSIGGIEQIFMASARLLVLVVGVAGIGFAIRHYFFPDLSADGTDTLDGLSAVAMAIVVIGLMAAIGPALQQQPGEVLRTLCFAVACNFGLQVIAFAATGAAGADINRVAYAIVAGNRNMAFFLAALPAAVMEPLFLFIGCYQVPMYLTPLVLGRLYRRV